MPHYPTKLSILLDFDGCTSTEEARIRLINDMINILKISPQIDELEVSIGSTRGVSFVNEFHAAQEHWIKNRKPHDSCAVLGVEFPYDLQSTVLEAGLSHVKVTFDDMLMGDVLNQLIPGTNFELMYQNRGNYKYWSRGKFKTKTTGLTQSGKEHLHIAIVPTDPSDPAQGIRYGSDSLVSLDEHKILMLYMQMHHKASNDPANNFMLDFYDDRADILETIQSFYRAHLDLIPANCCLRINQFYCSTAPANFPLLQDNSEEDRRFSGTGIVNTRFLTSVRDITVAHNAKFLGKQWSSGQALAGLQTSILTEHQKAVAILNPPQVLLNTTASMFKRPLDPNNENDGQNSPVKNTKRSRQVLVSIT